MKKQLLSVMLLAGALLVGCQSNSVELTEEVMITERGVDELERQQQAHIDEIRKSINGDQEEMTTEEQQEKPSEKTYLEIVGEIRGGEIKRGLTYENFLMVGDSDFDSLYEVFQLFGQGELIGERGNIRQYRWTLGKGGSYKVVQIVFINGKVESKSQSGLK